MKKPKSVGPASPSALDRTALSAAVGGAGETVCGYSREQQVCVCSTSKETDDGIATQTWNSLVAATSNTNPDTSENATIGVRG